MQALLPWIAVAIVILTGWLIFKRYQTAMVLFMAGMVLILLALASGVDNIAAKGVKPRYQYLHHSHPPSAGCPAVFLLFYHKPAPAGKPFSRFRTGS